MFYSPAWELWWLAAPPVLGNLRSSRIILIHHRVYVQLVCVLDWHDSEIWVPIIDCQALISMPYSQFRPKPQYVLRMLLDED